MFRIVGGLYEQKTCWGFPPTRFCLHHQQFGQVSIHQLRPGGRSSCDGDRQELHRRCKKDITFFNECGRRPHSSHKPGGTRFFGNVEVFFEAARICEVCGFCAYIEEVSVRSLDPFSGERMLFVRFLQGVGVVLSGLSVLSGFFRVLVLFFQVAIGLSFFQGVVSYEKCHRHIIYKEFFHFFSPTA